MALSNEAMSLAVVPFAPVQNVCDLDDNQLRPPNDSERGAANYHAVLSFCVASRISDPSVSLSDQAAAEAVVNECERVADAIFEKLASKFGE